MIDSLLFCWDKNIDYAQRLVADLSDESMVIQPSLVEAQSGDASGNASRGASGAASGGAAGDPQTKTTPAAEGQNSMTAGPPGAGKLPGVGGMNHPAWILSHLNIYHPVMVSLIKGVSFDDPKGHEFGMQSRPVSDRSVYPPKSELIDTFISGHNAVTIALRTGGKGALEKPVTLERWVEAMPTVKIALTYLMVLHESTHLGQISGWRRVQGLKSV